MPIRILAPHEAAKIAAGEVIERPASVVKELIENSLDAGATQVAVEVREGGLALIRVADDGCGIEPQEVRLAFERHATSKVRAEEDLWRVATLGFRGEALPSIAAAGDVELLTRVAGNDRGARIRLRAGEIVDEGSGAASPGTVFTVRALFSAQPARLKFLRGAGAEATQVSSVVMHYAMAYPEVRFTLVIDGRTALQTPGSGGLLDAIAGVYGGDVAYAAIELDVPAAHEGGVGVRGIAVEPRLHRATRGYISLYVNRRWVKNRALTFAVEEAYQGLLPVGRRPIAVLDLRMPADEVDVNVHPTKAEVRLRRERDVFGALQRAVRGALAGHAVVPAASPAVWGSQPGQAVSRDVPPLFLRAQALQAPLVQQPLLESQPGAAEARGEVFTRPSYGREGAPSDEAMLGADGTTTVARQPETAVPHFDPATAQGAPMVERLPMLRAVGQVGTMYVVAEGPDGMYLIDQHAAHERVLYERFLASVRAGKPEAQGLLEPLTVELSASHQMLLLQHATAFERLGFDLEHFGDRAFVVRAVPSMMADDPARRIGELLDRMQRDDGADDASHRAAASLACHAAVRAGMAMSAEEQRELLRALEGVDQPRTCPHGRPTVVHLAADALAREFRRK